MNEDLQPALQKTKRLSSLFSKIRLGFLAIGIAFLSTIPVKADDALAKDETQPLLTKTGGFEMGYLYSFLSYDKCGEYNLGQRFREALLAKLESCPFTEEAKQKFYKDIALAAGEVLTETYKLFNTNSPAELGSKIDSSRKDEHCESPDRQRFIKTLRVKLWEYDEGQIKLADVIVGRDGKTITCLEASKSGYEDSFGLGGSSSPQGPNTAPAGYVVYQNMPLDPAENGIGGFLQILQDERVTPEYRKSWGTSNNPQQALGKNDPLVQSIKTTPLKNGRFRIVDVNGHTIHDEELEAPLGNIGQVFLYGTKFPTFLVTVDLGIGIGSYAGPTTMLVEVRNGKVTHIQAAEDAGGEKDRIWLGRSVKNAWKIIFALNGKGNEIQQVQCHPNFDNPHWDDTGEFVVVYTTYRFTDGKWHRASRQKIGFWENEDWPARSEFP